MITCIPEITLILPRLLVCYKNSRGRIRGNKEDLRNERQDTHDIMLALAVTAGFVALGEDKKKER